VAQKFIAMLAKHGVIVKQGQGYVRAAHNVVEFKGAGHKA